MGSNKPNWKQMENSDVVVCQLCDGVFAMEDASGLTVMSDLGRCPFCAGPMFPACNGFDPTGHVAVGFDETVTFSHNTTRDIGGPRCLAICTRDFELAKSWVTHVYPAVKRYSEQGFMVLDIDRENPVGRVFSTSMDAAMAIHKTVPSEILDNYRHWLGGDDEDLDEDEED